MPESRACGGSKSTRTAAGQLRTYFVHNVEKARSLVQVRQEKGGDVGLIEHVSQFMRAVRGIDIHQDRPHPGGRELQYHPLRPVRGPEAYMFAWPDAQAKQSDGGFFYLQLEVPVD